VLKNIRFFVITLLVVFLPLTQAMATWASDGSGKKKPRHHRVAKKVAKPATTTTNSVQVAFYGSTDESQLFINIMDKRLYNENIVFENDKVTPLDKNGVTIASFVDPKNQQFAETFGKTVAREIGVRKIFFRNAAGKLDTGYVNTIVMNRTDRNWAESDLEVFKKLIDDSFGPVKVQYLPLVFTSNRFVLPGDIAGFSIKE
jgi:hypothetical protein